MKRLILFGSEIYRDRWHREHADDFPGWKRAKELLRHPDGREIFLVVAHPGCETRFRGCTFADLEVHGPYTNELSKAAEDARSCVHMAKSA